ncbi:hypothetical protein C8R48DRAFT_680490 [Suillus tomentosus]|nr:hypothetical protein C8R48DRAFT_680490 [Suillus tomentosus]
MVQNTTEDDGMQVRSPSPHSIAAQYVRELLEMLDRVQHQVEVLQDEISLTKKKNANIPASNMKKSSKVMDVVEEEVDMLEGETEHIRRKLREVVDCKVTGLHRHSSNVQSLTACKPFVAQADRDMLKMSTHSIACIERLDTCDLCKINKEQSFKETCTLTHQTVHYTCNDLVAFAKSTFVSKKRKYIDKTDEGRAMKRQTFNIGNNGSVARNILLRIMSDQVSELDTNNEDEKQATKTDINKAASHSKRDVCAGVPVWESIRPAWRSEESSQRFSKSETQSEMSSASNLSEKQYSPDMLTLATTNNNAPPLITIFPFMLDSKCYDSYQAGTPYAPIEMYEQDP